MTPILISIILAFTICAYFYARVVIKERSRHLEAQRDAEIAHAADWKDLAVKLTERGLLFREMPMLQEKIDAIEEAHEIQGAVGEMSLEEIDDEMAELDSPLRFSSHGELGRRRQLAAQREKLRRNADLKESELATEPAMNTFGLTESDLQHLSGNQ